MKFRYFAFSLALTVVALVQAACNLPRAERPDPASTLNALYTQSAQTLEAMASQSAPTLAIASPTPLSTSTPAVSSPLPPVWTSTPITRCDWADFVSDMTYPDGSVLGRNEPFTKVWRIRNIGTCSWTGNYALVFVSGDAMDAPVAVALTGNVNPGQTVDIPVNLVSPGKDGRYRGYFKLRNASGVLFGVGPQAATSFWVDIAVTGENFVAYDFASNFCDANWNNGQIYLPCPGVEGDGAGYAIAAANPKLENGNQSGSVGLLTVPRDANNGYIQGVYPPIRVKDGDRFRSIVNCRYNSAGCNVVFRLDYQVGGGALKNLGQWNEAYEGQWYSLDIDLSPLKGQDVVFVFTVHANGAFFKDFAMWIGPRLLRPGPPPPTLTPTSTPTVTLTPSATATLTAMPTATETVTETQTPTPASTP